MEISVFHFSFFLFEALADFVLESVIGPHAEIVSVSELAFGFEGSIRMFLREIPKLVLVDSLEFEVRIGHDCFFNFFHLLFIVKILGFRSRATADRLGSLSFLGRRAVLLVVVALIFTAAFFFRLPLLPD